MVYWFKLFNSGLLTIKLNPFFNTFSSMFIAAKILYFLPYFPFINTVILKVSDMMILILVLEKNVDNRISHFLVKISDMKTGLCDLMRDTICY